MYFYATIHNQYTRPIGRGSHVDRAEAIRLAHADADHTLKTANPNWKWRKARVKVQEMPGDIS